MNGPIWICPPLPVFKKQGDDIMFHDFVKSKLEAGKIAVRPSARNATGEIDIQASGITAIAVWFLSRKEKERIAEHSKYVAMRKYRVSVDELKY